MSEQKKENSTEVNWKEIAEKLAQKVNFAITYLKAPGSGMIYNSETRTSRYWKESFADVLEMIPGVEVDRELMRIYDLPSSQRDKALKRLEKERGANKDAA